MSSQNIFVFAVCGAAEYIEALNLSLRYLKRFCANEIIVVTELRRNEIPIEHENLIDVETPSTYSNHQASIYLKTSLHRYVDLNHNYCYLDGDVVAVRPGVEQIFMYNLGPVTFTSDHCRMPSFSPHAVNCGCWGKAQQDAAHQLTALLDQYGNPSPATLQTQKRLEETLAEFIQAKMVAFYGTDDNSSFEEWQGMFTPEMTAKREQLIQLFAEAKSGNLFQFVRKFTQDIWPHYRRRFRNPGWVDREGRLVMSLKKGPPDTWTEEAYAHIQATLGYTWNPDQESWTHTSGEVIYTNPVPLIEKNSDFTWDAAANEFLNTQGQPVFSPRCTHLKGQIQTQFGVVITEPAFQHWNGGAFLFGKDSVGFLEYWHTSTLSIFEDPDWKTRDQGTLIASVWKFGLQDQGTLPIEFNFLADYQNPAMQFDKAGGFSFTGQSKSYQPYFLHIYHHWGDAAWPVWAWVNDLLQEQEVLQ